MILLILLLLITPSALVAQAIYASRVPETAGARAPQHIRQGLWADAGLGYGALRSNNGASTGGATGELVIGGALSPRFLLGGGTTLWTKTAPGVDGRPLTLRTGTLGLRLRYYPQPRYGIFVMGGAGLGFIRFSQPGSNTSFHTGLGALLGMGYDIRVAPNVNLTPHISGFLVRTDDPYSNVVQGGVALTIQ